MLTPTSSPAPVIPGSRRRRRRRARCRPCARQRRRTGEAPARQVRDTQPPGRRSALGSGVRVFGQEAVAVDDGRGESKSLRFASREWWRSISNAVASLTEWRSIGMPLARSVMARRPNAPSRLWYSASRRSTMSIELCQSSVSASVMQAKTPRLEASLTKSASGAWSTVQLGASLTAETPSVNASGASSLLGVWSKLLRFNARGGASPPAPIFGRRTARSTAIGAERKR